MAREFFRIVRGRRPTLDDFKPVGTKVSRRLRNPAFRREFEEGISVYDDFDHACEMAEENRFRHGTSIVKVVVPDDGSVEFKQTFGQHHYTIYAEPERILALAEAIAVPIPNAPGA